MFLWNVGKRQKNRKRCNKKKAKLAAKNRRRRRSLQR